MDRFATIEDRNRYLASLEQYRPEILAYFYKHLDAYHKQEAEDLTQEVFTQTIRAVKSSERPLTHARAYLYAAAKNLCTKVSGEKVAISLDQQTTPDAEQQTTPLRPIILQSTDELEGVEQLSDALSAIQNLTGLTRAVMQLVAQNLTVNEIARKLGISEATAREHRTKGREILHRRLHSPEEVDGSEQA